MANNRSKKAKSRLDLRRKAYDKLKDDGYTRPGSTNARKQA